MKSKNRIMLERIAGQVEGLAFGIKNKEISGRLLDIAANIDWVIQDESEGETE